MNDRKQMFYILAIVFYPFVIYFAIKAAPYINEGGPLVLMEGLYSEIDRPFHFIWGTFTTKAVIVVSFIYLFICVLIYDGIKNYRYDEEFGSARWATVREINKRYAAKENVFGDIPMWRQNMILTKGARMGFDFERPEHQKNANTFILGGPGTWKSRGYSMPNIMQMNGSFVVTDPKGEMARKLGHMLVRFGYRVLVFDINKPDKSVCYNPFKYFRNDKDVLQFVTNFFNATENKRASKQDDFWDKQAMNLMLAFTYYLYHFAPSEEQNFGMINELLLAADVKDDADALSAVDLIFARLEKEYPNHIAVKYYKSYHKGGAKTLQSIQSTLSARLAYFNLEAISKLTATDDIDICRMATEKTAIFCVIPDADQSLNFLVGTMYQQMFQQLYDLADNVYNGKLPMHIRFIMDEFANVALPDNYQNILSTARSRNISFAIIIQDKSQIEKIFEVLHKTIMGCCSEWLFLGSNELDVCKMFAELCGKETIYVKEYSRSYGRNGGYSVSTRKQQRDLCDADEIRRKANRIALLIIEGEHALKDEKYNMKHHKYYKYVAEGKNLKRRKDPAYIFDWGTKELATGEMQILPEYRGSVIDLQSMNIKTPKVMTDEELNRRVA
ncbi:MAG: type IV secretory system conjugative DNA transfer family protein [Lachnospiraceae bacterium]|nr:type IV secretory system conjugative DNA transfer family protein [Lachnospiraceae bacterium]